MESQASVSSVPEAALRGEVKTPLTLTLFRAALILGVLYAFLLSIGLMGAGFKVFGKDFAQALIETTSNPFVGLFVGVLATALIQSSSTTTSMVVAFVAAGTITVDNAIPVVMGSNMGTAVTSTLVSLGHVTRKHEFKRAFAAGTVHDLFNLLTVVVLLPVELMTGFLSKSSHALAGALTSTSGLEFKSPLKMVTKPICGAIVSGVEALELSKMLTGALVVGVGAVLLIVSLIFLSKLLKALVLSKLERFFERSVGRSGVLAILIGLFFTVIVQSSSVTTSLMIPMAAAGVMSLRQVFPVALGANVGTTVTALLASLATGQPEALTIALAHMMFNLSGILLFYPIPQMRRIPMYFAEILSLAVVRNRMFAPAFILVVYFLVPGLAVLFT